MCWRSLLSNLRTLSLDTVLFQLPALQPVATRLQRLDIAHSGLLGSADGFFAGWTALTSLSLHCSWLRDNALTTLRLPALKVLHAINFIKSGERLHRTTCAARSFALWH